MKSLGASLFGWRVISWRGNLRVVAHWQLTPEDQPLENPGVLVGEIEDWGRNSERFLYDLHEAAYGFPAPNPLSDRDTILGERIQDAFRIGRLLLVPDEGDPDRPPGGGGGGGGGGPKPPPPPPKKDDPPPPTPGGGGGEDPPPPKKPKKTWFKAILKDEDGEPMVDEDYILVDTDGVQRKGKLDGEGAVYIPEILPPGLCTISFPNIHLNPLKRKK